MHRLSLLLLVLVLAGCTAPTTVDGPSSAEPGATPSSRVDVAAPRPGGQVAGARGALQGIVSDLHGAPVANARVELVGVAVIATTDNTGAYLFDTLRPGDYLLYVRHDKHQQASGHVTILAGTTTKADVRLAPSDAAAPVHVDFWQGRSTVRVADGSYFGSDGPIPATHCLAGAKTRWGPMPTIRFDEERQLVWPGTAEILVVLDWDEASFRGDRLAVVWRNHPDGAYALTPFATRGETIRIPLTPEQADLPRQTYTRWELGICSRDNSGHPGQVANSFNGAVHAQVDLVRGHPLPLLGPEPTLWSNTTRLPVLNESRLFDASDPTLWAVQPCHGPAAQRDGLTARAEWFKFVPSQGLLVPPGTQAIEATLTWTSTDIVGSPVLDLAYRTAAIAPWVPDDASTYRGLEPESSEPGRRFYRFTVDPKDTDGWEDARSAWSFHFALEGAEHVCLDLDVRLEVAAIRLQP